MAKHKQTVRCITCPDRSATQPDAYPPNKGGVGLPLSQSKVWADGMHVHYRRHPMPSQPEYGFVTGLKLIQTESFSFVLQGSGGTYIGAFYSSSA